VATAFTNRDGSTLIEAPTLYLRVGRGLFRDADLRSQREAQQVREEAVFKPNDRGKVLHFVVQSFKAGAPWSPVVAVLEVEIHGDYRVGQNKV
jgi:hypothetical protein